MIKSWMESLLIALSMYSALPVKCLNWTERTCAMPWYFFRWWDCCAAWAYL